LMEVFQLKSDQLLEGSYFEILNPWKFSTQ
jgi:hypothetical protein